MIRLDLSDDGALIAVLTDVVDEYGQSVDAQYLKIYEWASPGEDPVVEAEIDPKCGFQRDVRFNPADFREIVTNSAF